jgi:hypothetical protein
MIMLGARFFRRWKSVESRIVVCTPQVKGSPKPTTRQYASVSEEDQATCAFGPCVKLMYSGHALGIAPPGADEVEAEALRPHTAITTEPTEMLCLTQVRLKGEMLAREPASKSDETILYWGP